MPSEAPGQVLRCENDGPKDRDIEYHRKTDEQGLPAADYVTDVASLYVSQGMPSIAAIYPWKCA